MQVGVTFAKESRFPLTFAMLEQWAMLDAALRVIDALMRLESPPPRSSSSGDAYKL